MEGREEKGKRRIKKEGERSRERRVHLSFDLPEAREVYVAGDFNSWDTQSLPMNKTKEGVWKVNLKLPSGRYEYNMNTNCLRMAHGSKTFRLLRGFPTPSAHRISSFRSNRHRSGSCPTKLRPTSGGCLP